MPAGRQGRRREIDSSIIINALTGTRTLEQAAGVIGCSAPAISARAKQDVGVKTAVREQERARESDIAEAIIDCKGILSKVAQRVGLGSGAAVRHHIARNPRLRDLFNEAREKVVDTAEDNVFEAVEEGNLAYSWKVLQTLGKDRGYTERKEIESQQVHSIDEASTDQLIAALNQAASRPEAIEAEFSEISPESQKLVMEALTEAAPPESTVDNE